MTKASRPKPQRTPSVVLDEKRKVFSDTLLETGNKALSARAAGYHPSNVDNVMREEDVQRYLEEARAEITDISTLKRIDVLNIFMDAISMARVMADPAQMINGADKIAKMMGYYAPETLKLEVENNSKALTNKFRQLSDAELYEIAASRATLVDGEVISKETGE